jgi:hypothetical protein
VDVFSRWRNSPPEEDPGKVEQALREILCLHEWGLSLGALRTVASSQYSLTSSSVNGAVRSLINLKEAFLDEEGFIYLTSEEDGWPGD